MLNLNKGDSISFQLKVNNIIGGNRSAVRVEAASVSYEVASMLDPELHVKHTALFPYFKETIGVDGVDNPANYDYIVLKNDNGVVEVIGEPWINQATLNVVETLNCNIVIQNYRRELRIPIEKFLNEIGATYTLTVFEKTT